RGMGLQAHPSPGSPPLGNDEDQTEDVEHSGALTADQVRDVLAWCAPLAVPPLDVVGPLLAEAARLGVTGAGAISSAGRALLADGDPAAALAADLPPPVDEVWLQADLTGIVPGRPSDRLARLLHRAARQESSGGALTVRFTPESVAAAVASTSADQVLAELAAVSRGPVPQGLEYLVRDAARRHDALRVGPAGAYLRSPDEALLTRVVADPALAGCGLARIAPTVVVAQVPPTQLAEDLASAGLAARTETTDGQVVTLGAPRRAHPRPAAPSREPTLADVRTAVARLRADRTQPDPSPDARPEASGLTTEPTHDPPLDPLDTLMILREAVDRRTDTWVDLVDDTGRTTRHRLRPVAVDGGRLRAVDPSRAVELTVAVHRIAAAAPVPAEP
ncbi:MAG: helicase-associated domain-containing protein, partial [Micrococcales bacterium]|nr:helicase-associated domain-containing protein [Micrococcales bacterium]